MSSSILARLYALLAWLLAAVSLLHMATTWRLGSAASFTRVWFFGAGIAMAEGAALNLLHRSYGRSAPGLRWSTRAFNALMLAFAGAAGLVTGASVLELVFLLGLLSGLLILSFTAAAHRAP